MGFAYSPRPSLSNTFNYTGDGLDKTSRAVSEAKNWLRRTTQANARQLFFTSLAAHIVRFGTYNWQRAERCNTQLCFYEGRYVR